MSAYLIVSIFLILSLTGYLVLRFGRANQLFPTSIEEWKELKKRKAAERIIQGDILRTWTFIPPVWKRLMVLSIVLAFLALNVYLGIDRSFSRIWYFLTMILAASFTLYIQELLPRVYHLTEKGIWCGFTWLLANPEKTKPSRVHRILWNDVEATERKKKHVKLIPRTSSSSSFLFLPESLLRELRKMEVHFPVDASDIEQMLQGYCQLP